MKKYESYLNFCLGFIFYQDKVVDAVNDGVASAKAAAKSASDTISDKAGKLYFYFIEMLECKNFLLFS